MGATAKAAINAGLLLVGVMAGQHAHCGLIADGGAQPAPIVDEQVAATDPLATTAPADNLIPLALGNSPAPDFAARAVNPQDTVPLQFANAANTDFYPGPGGLHFGPMPEPGTLSLFGLAMLVWAFVQHRRR